MGGGGISTTRAGWWTFYEIPTYLPMVYILKVAVLMAQVWRKPYSSGLRLARIVSPKREDHTDAAEGRV